MAEELGNVSKAYKVMGVSRETFYRYRDAVAEGGVDALIDKNRRILNLENRVAPLRVAPLIEQAVTDYATRELRKEGVFVSPYWLRSIWAAAQSADVQIAPESP